MQENDDIMQNIRCKQKIEKVKLYFFVPSENIIS